MSDLAVWGFRRVPEFARGLVRDLRVRWALGEAGLGYEQRLIEGADLTSESYRQLHPFGMIPLFEDGGEKLFESGAIVHSIAENCQVLMPTAPRERRQTLAWMFAALNTVEPPVNQLSVMDLQLAGEEWVKLGRPAAVAAVHKRLQALSGWLESRDHLMGRFTAADILMVTVLRLIGHTDLLAEYPSLRKYVDRCEGRPAFQKALSDQLASYAD